MKTITPEYTLTMMGNQPICDLQCIPQQGEPIIGAGDPRPRTEKAGNWYPGTTRPNPDFKAGKCVITGDGCCGHPMRNALQSQHSRNPEIMRRWLSAKRHLKAELAELAVANTT